MRFLTTSTCLGLENECGDSNGVRRVGLSLGLLGIFLFLVLFSYRIDFKSIIKSFFIISQFGFCFLKNTSPSGTQ